MASFRGLGAGLRRCSLRFRAEECGAGTVFSLFIFVIALLFGGLAIDAGNAWRYGEILKSTADVAAHAGAVTLAEGGSAGEAETAARKALGLNTPRARFGRILRDPGRDVRAVHYDPSSGTLSPGAEANAVEVLVQRSAATANPVPTLLLRFAGLGSWNVAKESLAAVLPTERCRGNDGIYAGGVLITGPGLNVGSGYCLHSQQQALPDPGSTFADGAGLSMPDLGRCGEMCTDAMSDGASKAAFEANLVRGDLSTMIVSIAKGFSDPKAPGPGEAGFFASRPMPRGPEGLAPLEEMGVPVKTLATGAIVHLSPLVFTWMRAAPAGLTYVVQCGSGRGGKYPSGAKNGVLTLGGGPMTMRFRNMALITDCAVHIGANVDLQGALIVSTRVGSGAAVTADPSARIGYPKGDCAPGHRTTIMALGSIRIPSGVMDANVGLVSGGDIEVSAPPGSGGQSHNLTGVGMHAAGSITLGASHDLESCPGAPDPFTPAIKVIRQVVPVAG